MKTTHDLSGRWTGYYSQHDHQRPVSLYLSQNGELLSGTMRDHCTSFVSSVSDLAMEEGLPPGSDEQIVARVRSLCPNTDHLPVRAEFILPEHSSLEGNVVGTAVRFTKTYHGEFFSGYRVGNMRVGVKRDAQTIRFRGIIGEDGTQIEGQWSMPEPEDAMRPIHRTEGAFVLQREPESR